MFASPQLRTERSEPGRALLPTARQPNYALRITHYELNQPIDSLPLTPLHAKKSTKNCIFIWSSQKKPVSLHRFLRKKGRLAQLVQSICLTSRGSAVRIRQRPHQSRLPQAAFFVSPPRRQRPRQGLPTVECTMKENPVIENPMLSS